MDAVVNAANASHPAAVASVAPQAAAPRAAAKLASTPLRRLPNLALGQGSHRLGWFFEEKQSRQRNRRTLTLLLGHPQRLQMLHTQVDCRTLYNSR